MSFECNISFNKFSSVLNTIANNIVIHSILILIVSLKIAYEIVSNIK